MRKQRRQPNTDVLLFCQSLPERLRQKFPNATDETIDRHCRHLLADYVGDLLVKGLEERIGKEEAKFQRMHLDFKLIFVPVTKLSKELAFRFDSLEDFLSFAKEGHGDPQREEKFTSIFEEAVTRSERNLP